MRDKGVIIASNTKLRLESLKTEVISNFKGVLSWHLGSIYIAESCVTYGPWYQ